MIAIEAAKGQRCIACNREYSTGGNDRFGPKCRRKIEARMRGLDDMSETQVEKSLDLIRDAGFVEVRPGIFQVLSATMYQGESELRRYRTNGLVCTCPHGVFGSNGKMSRCFHARTVREIKEVRSGSRVG
jgi:hypothetical protein